MITEPQILHHTNEETLKYLEDLRSTPGWPIVRRIIELEMFKAEYKLCYGGIRTPEEVAAQQAIIKSMERALQEITRTK